MVARNAALVMVVCTGFALAAPPAKSANERIGTKTDSLSVEVPTGWSATPEEQAIRLHTAEAGVGMFVMHGFLPYDPDGFIDRIRNTPGNRVVRVDGLHAAGKDGKEMVWTNRAGARGGSGTVVDVLLPSDQPERSNIWIRLTMPRGVDDAGQRRYQADLRSVLDSLRLGP